MCRLAQPGRSSLTVKDSAVDASDQIKWAWSHGALTSIEDFHNPAYSSATYRLCLYDSSAKPQPLLEADIPPGGMCGFKPCWKPTALRGFVYKNRQGLPDGVVSLKLIAGGDGKAKIQALGKGASLQTPALPLTLPVTAQLVIVNDGSTQCWQTTFTAATSTTSFFRATGP
jgi:hypothetical protein